MKILVAKINFLGDAVTFLPTLQGIVENVEDANLIVLTTAVGRQVFEGTIPMSDLLVYDYHEFRNLYKRPREFFHLVAHIRQLGCEFSLLSFDEPSASYLLSYLGGIKKRVGFRSRIARLNFLLTHPLALPVSQNVVDINFELVRWLTGNEGLLPRRVPIAYTDKEKFEIDRALLGKGIPPGSPFVAIHPFAKFRYKEWAIFRYLELAALIEDRLSIPVVFLSETGRMDVGERFRLLSGLSVKALACVLERALVLIGNNSGPMHLAAAMGTPTVVIQGPSAPQWDVYWKDTLHMKICSNFLPCIPCDRIGHIPARCTNQEYPGGCLEEIRVNAVFDCVSAVLMNRPVQAKVNLDGK